MASVNIPNVGIVNFPDTMSADDISNVIKTQIIPQATPSGGAIAPDGAVNQVAPLPTVKDYGVGTFLADLGKGVAGTAIKGTAAMPLAAEGQLRSSARDALAGQLQRPEGVAGLAYDLNRIETPQKMLFNKALDAFKAGESVVGSHVISDMATKMENIFKSDEQIKSEKQAKKQADLVLAQVPHSESLQQLYTFGKEKGKEFSESQSEKVKNAIQNSQATGNVLKAIKDRNFDSFSLGKDPSVLGYVMQGSEVLGSLLPMIAATVVTKSPTVATGMGYLQSGSEAIDTTRTFIDSKTDEELAASSPYFKEMVASGVDPQQARKVITDRAEESAAQLQGAVGAFGGNITGQLITGAFDKVLDKYAKSRLAKIALGTPAAMAEQGTEEFLEGIASDIGVNTEVVKEIGEESFANFLLGAIGGAPIGLYSGATAKTEKQKEAEAAEQARQEELKKANIVTPETAAETAPQVTTSPVVTPGEVDIPEALETPTAAALPQEAPVEQAAAQGAAQNLQPIPFDTVAYDTAEPNNLRRSSGESPVIDYSGRKIVMQNINGVQVPFYLSTGSGGKKDVPDGKWYPFFGIGADGWINKTGGQEMASYYGSDALRQAAEQLDQTIGDIRNDNTIPKVAKSGAHIDFINQGLAPAENNTKDTLANVRANIESLLAKLQEPSQQKVEENQQVESTLTPVNVQPTQQALPPGFEHFEEVQPDGSIKAGFRRIKEAVAEEKPAEAAPVEAPKTQAQINQERQQEKKLSQIDATGIPLVVYYNGLLSGINNSPVATLEKMHGEETKPALEILKANNLVTINPGNKIYILPKGQQLLDEIRQKSSLGKQLNASESEALFAKYIKQIQEAPTEEAATPVEPVAEEVVQEAPQEAAPRQSVYEPIANPNPLEQKVIDIYKSIKEANPNANVDEEIVNPNRYHFVEEKPNAKGIKIGDKVYQKGDPIPKTVVTVLEERVKLADENGRGGFSDIKLVSDTPVPYDYSFDFGYGPINVNVNKFVSGKHDWEFNMYGPGASETGYRSVLAIPFEGKQGTKEFDDFVERVVKANTAASKAKAPTKEEKVAANKQRQAEKKAVVKEKPAEKPKAEPKVEKVEEAAEESKPVSSEDARNLLVRFNAGQYKVTEEDGKRWFYKDAVRAFLEGDLKAKVPGKENGYITAEGLEDVQPKAIEKKVAKAKDEFWEQKKALETIAATKDIRFYLNGVLIDTKSNKLVATDGSILAVVNKPNLKDAPKITGDQQVIDRGGALIPDTKFPDYNRVVPQTHAENKTTVNAPKLAAYVRGVQKANRYARGNPKYSQASLIIDGKRYFYNSQYIITMAEFFQKMGYDSFEMSTPVGDGKLYATSKDGKVELVLMPMRVDKTDSFTAPYDVNVAKPIKEFKEAPTLSTSNIEPTTQQETLGVVAPLGSAETRTDKEFAEQSEKDREEVIQEYRVARAAGRRILRKVAAEGSNLRMQKELNDLLTNEEALKDYLDLTRPTRNNAVDFMRRATDALADGVIDESVEAFIRDVYEKYPNILEGLRLSIRSRKVDGKDAGNFNAFSRLVTLWTDGSGVDNPKTIRHELMHSLEQMMTPQAKQNLVEAWYKALAKAMKENTDEPSRKYFEAVNEFLNDPSEETMKAAIKVLPSYDLYQYLNPSEFWAVNAEKLMEQKLGTPWNRFVIAVKRLFEGLKNVLGFDNQYAVHKAFNDLIEGKAPRQDKQREMIVDYLTQGKFQPTFLENIKDDQDLVDDLGVNEVPNNDKKTAKEMLAVGWNKLMQFAKELYDDPLNKFTHTLVEASDKATMARIEAIDFAAGVRDRDFAQTKGQIRYANGQFVASLSVKNALHSAHIATQVILRGGLEYSTKYGQFLAVAKDHSIKNIIQLQYDIRKKLGKKLGDQIINTYLIARRTRSIQNEYLTRLAMLENAKQEYEDADPANKPAFALELEEAQDAYDDIVKAYNKIPKEFLQKDQNDEIILDKITDANGNVIEELPIVDDDAVDRAVERDTVHPELAEIMTNWTAVNHNMLDNLAFSGRISQKTADALKKIKDYVPWNRVMDEEEGVRGGAKRQRSAGIAKFKKNRTERDVDNVVERMQEFVAARTISAIRSYAENRIAMQYGTRNDKGKLRVFSDEGKSEDGVRLRIYANGRSINIEIKDHLVAEALMGLTATPIEYDFQRILSGSANFFRRSITFTGYFQVKQVFYDAPTAAWISGTRNPFKLFAGCFSGFLKGLNPVSTDPVIDLMKSAGFGGYFGAHRSAKKETKLELGAFTKEGYALVMKFIDKLGDASDTSQRIPTYNRVFAETGDPALALYMASDVMDFSKHGKAKLALFLRSTVTFMQAYATQIDALSQAAIGGNIKGNSRGKAFALFYATYIPLATTCILLAMAAGEDDDYWKLDDETRASNFYMPYSTRMFGHPVLIPMHSSASLFFKVVPEIALNQLTEFGTKDKMDKRRLHKLLANMAQDTLLGPSPFPTGLKAPTEIVLNHSFFTGSAVTPQNLKKLTAARQYTANTSELGKKLSSWTSIPFTKDKRVLTPIEMDHLIRGQLGTVGALSMWFSNEIFKDQRVAPQARENPLLGGFVGADVPRKQEDLFYDMKEATDTAYSTYMNLVTHNRNYEAAKFFKENEKLIEGYGYTSGVDQALKTINAEVRRLGDRPNELLEVDQEIQRVKEDKAISISEKAQLLGELYADRGVIEANIANLNKRSPEQKRADINMYARNKNEILQDVEQKRRELFGLYED